MLDYYNVEVEVWKEVPEFEAYEISNLGNLRSRFKRRRGFGAWPREYLKRWPVKPYPCAGYPSYKLYKTDGSNKQYTRYAHELVLIAFVSPRPDNMECRHLDGNRKNANRDNLCWGTSTENTSDKERHGSIIRGEKCPHAKLKELDIHEIFRLRAIGLSQYKIAARVNTSRSQVGRILARERWAHVSIKAV